jgi:hypothetical protein
MNACRNKAVPADRPAATLTASRSTGRHRRTVFHFFGRSGAPIASSPFAGFPTLPFEEDAMLPTTIDRVPLHTPEHINEQIQQQTIENLERAVAGGSAAIGRRLRELDSEWDVERLLETNASSIILMGLGLGAVVSRKWFLLPAAVAGFLLQHALQGWCPPIPVLRRMGFRTQREIDEERYALKILRGDFLNLRGQGNAVGRVMKAVQN